MAIADFLARIGSPRLLNVARHWLDARGARRMPRWSNLDPLAIAPELPIVWAWKYDRRSGTFTGRLSGEDIVDLFGKTLRGVAMTEFFHPKYHDVLLARHRRVVLQPALVHGSGPIFVHAGRHGHGERIILPLAEDGENGDGLIGATVYPVAASPEVVIGLDSAETVLFFPLD